MMQDLIRSAFAFAFALLDFKYFTNICRFTIFLTLTYPSSQDQVEVVLGLTHLFSLRTRYLGERELLSDSILDDAVSCPFWT